MHRLCRCRGDGNVPCRSSRWWELNPTTPVWRTGVSPQHFTCLVVSEETGLVDGGARRHVRRSFVGRVGIEPTWRRSKSPLQRQLLLPTCRAVPGAPRDVAPPPGVEPGPLGFRPSAQTSYAKVRKGAVPREQTPRRGTLLRDGCLPGHPHHHRSSVVRDLPRRARGAPRAVAQSRNPQLHPSRTQHLD